MLTAAPSAVPAPVCSRRVGAGVRPAPGATSRRPAWWSAEDWVEVEVRGAVDEQRDLCRAHHVDPDTVLAVARGMASFADFRTGRDCRPTNPHLVELLRLSLSTVQRARRGLKELGPGVGLLPRRAIMPRADRLPAGARGSSHRRIAAEFALCSRRRRPQPCSRVVERDTPPGTSTETTSVTRSSPPLRTTTEPRRGASRPAHTPKGPPAGNRRLAEGVQRRPSWLSGVSPPPPIPPLHPLAPAPPTPPATQTAPA